MFDESRTALVGIAVLAPAVCFSGLLCPLQEPQESRYAEIPRQMLAEGSVVVPLLHGQPYYDKPPLFYWLIMASYSAFGVSESAARLVPCLAAFLTILISYGWAWRLAGARAAFLGSAILCLSLRFVQLDRMLTLDSLLAYCVVAAWASGHLALIGNRLRVGWWLASAVACGLGLLTKGPVALVLVAPVLLALRWLDRESARPGWRALSGYLAVSVGLAAPWFIAVAVRDETFLAYFFWFHHVQRYVEPFDHAEPFWFYVPEILVGMLPWSLLLPGLVIALVRGTSDTRPIRVLLLAGFWCVGFFSLAGCKRGFYVLPAVPPLALALGCYLDRVLGEASLSGWMALYRHRSRHAFVALLVVILGAIGGSIAGCVCGFIGVRCGAMIGAVALTGGLVAVGFYVRQGGRVSWAEAGGAMTLLMLAAVFVFMPGYAEKFSLRDELLPDAACGLAHTPIICYPRSWDSVNFYLGRDDVRAFKANELDALLMELAQSHGTVVVARTGFADSVRQRLPASVEWEPLGRPGHLTMGRVMPRPP